MCTTSVWLHGDLHSRNVVLRDGARSGLIDGAAVRLTTGVTLAVGLPEGHLVRMREAGP